MEIILQYFNGSTCLTYFARETIPVTHIRMPAKRNHQFHGKWAIDAK